MEIFGRHFEHIDTYFLDDLEHLEKDGAIYSQFWQEDSQDFRFCRIPFKPAEIVRYVDACEAFDQYSEFATIHGDGDEALDRVKNGAIRDQVMSFNRRAKSARQFEAQYCFAAFIGPELENLVCGGSPSRYEFFAKTYTGDRRFLLTEFLEGFPTCAAILTKRSGNRVNYPLDNEIDVRDLLYALLKGLFPDARIEEYTPVHAGSSKKIDIVLPTLAVVVEVKFVRDIQHAKRVADELKIDIESYHTHASCNKLIAFVWDPNGYLVDRPNFIQDLRGPRQRGDKKYSVDVFVKP